MKKIDIKSLILGIIISSIVFSIGVSAKLMFKAEEVEYTPSDLRFDVDNVNDALNLLMDETGKFMLDYEYHGEGEGPDKFPLTPSGYSVGSLNCEGATGEWDNRSWSIKLKDYTNSRVKCTAILYDVKVDDVWDVPYKGSGYDRFVIPATGKYLIELWGAQGGTYNSSYQGGKGAYTSGIISMTEGEKLYFYVGGQGGSNDTQTNVGGYNGGGYSGSNPGVKSMGGGGATDVRYFDDGDPTDKDLDWQSTKGLRSRIMVAAGGGGHVYASNQTTNSGIAGGLTGGSVTGSYPSIGPPTGGTQTGPGSSYEGTRGGGFGYASQSITGGWGGGGGSGYYGGGNGCGHGGAGGSSFISGYTGCNAINRDGTHKGNPNHYSNKIFESPIMKDGATSMTNPKTNTSETGHSGDGHARIKLISVD